MIVLHAGDGFDATRNVHLALARDDALRGQRDGLQARGAVTIHGHARGGHGTSGAQRDLARDVEAGGAFGIGAAHEHVFDRGRIELRAFHGVFDHVRRRAWRHA